ncbi:CDP-alcohol phosphatidyltransferase [Spirosoma radiotolerans]|uniref:CDP-alcohol phosphatidyltransferase n=2 Tax=Spirosoma radiotolerans TaxID=1379870 RepID=A0A0E3ZY58_9BACT|nr:CDP-alcohol phosphatidyltransferase [Spirosoma radiotolerans]
MQQALTLRTKIQLGIYTVINPFVKLLIRLGLTPNMVTTIGLVLNIGVAFIFIAGAEQGNRGDFSYIGWAGALVLFAGLFDMLDGQVARLGKMSSLYGALFDSVLDRYSELIMFLGICYYLISHHYFFSSLFAFIALIGSMMVSYTRARAEGLGIECKGGLMQRPERVITIGVSALACGCFAPLLGSDFKVYIPGIPIHVFETMSIFTLPLVVMAIMTNITAYNRLMDAKRGLEEKEKPSSLKTFAVTFLLLGSVLGYSVPTSARAASALSDDSHQEKGKTSFPIPKGIPNQLFYIQRDPNPNTIICTLNLKNGQLDKQDPVHVFWIRYTEQSQQKELSYIQRTFAYGVKARPVANEQYELTFVSYKKLPLHLVKSDHDAGYYVYATVNQKKVILRRIYLHIEGGTMWMPNVKYIQLEGTNALTGESTVERIMV